MKCIYWNINKIEDVDLIIDICNQEVPEIFFLSEINEDYLAKIETKITEIGYEVFYNPGCERVNMIKKKELDINLNIQDKYYTTIYHKSLDLYIISIHFPSQMFEHMNGQKDFIRDFRFEIDAEIGTSLEKRILIIGDFNVNPYEDPMIAFDGFVASNSTKSKPIIKHLKKERISYYNPTWQLYSRKYFPGTKHFKRPSGSSFDIFEHHYLDQVLVSQKLLNDLTEEEIDVIEKTNKFQFFDNKKNKIEKSDHLPLSYKFKI